MSVGEVLLSTDTALVSRPERNQPDPDFSVQIIVLGFWFQVKQVLTMHQSPSSKSRRALSSMSKVSGATLATKEVKSFSCNEMANAEGKVKQANKKTRPATDLIIDRSTLPRLSSSLQVLMDGKKV